MFKGILLTKPEGVYTAAVQSIDDSVLGDGDVTVGVEWSTLNYKDGLAITGKSPVVRKFPLVPGIDFAGTVYSSQNPRWKVGDKVILNGWGVGETCSGGLAQTARVKGDWLVALPAAFTARQAMAIGTAGYTAMLCVMALEKHGVKPTDGEVLVTGANGGVGSVAVALLSKLGYTVVASTGRMAEAAHLQALGATTVIDRPIQPRQAPGQRTLGCRGRQRRQPHPGQCLRFGQIQRRSGGLWPGAGNGLPGFCSALYLAWHHALRH